jgi:hypothetical protein
VEFGAQVGHRSPVAPIPRRPHRLVIESDRETAENEGVAWRTLTAVLVALALGAFVSLVVLRNALQQPLHDVNQVAFLDPDGSLTQQRKQAAGFCSTVGVQRFAEAFDVDATPLAVSGAYADNVQLPRTPQHRAIRAGCFAGLTR